MYISVWLLKMILLVAVVVYLWHLAKRLINK